MTAFHFEDASDREPPHDVFTARIPRGIRSKQKLLRVLADKLQFPDYFGENWDALEECLRDLSWLKHRRISLCHADLPFGSGGENRQIYLQILQSAAHHWSEFGERELVCVFPEDTRAEIGALTSPPADNRPPAR